MTALETPRLRMIAGPNGSGKSTAKAMLRPGLLENYLNADDIEASIRTEGYFDFTNWQLAVEEMEVRDFFSGSTLLDKANLLERASDLPFRENRLYFARDEINSYFASVIADFVRRKFVAQHRSFTFETVMSSPDKVDFLQRRAKFRLSHLPLFRRNSRD